MPGVLQMVQVTKQPQKIQTWLVQNESFLLVNPDIVNNIFIGNDPSSQPIAVPALGSVTLTSVPGHDTWVSTGGSVTPVSAYLMPNGSNWTPSPAQVAAQINALGLAKDTTLQTTNTNTNNTATNVNAVNTSVQATPNSTAALIATGSAGGTPGGAPLLRKTLQLGTSNALVIGASGVGTLANLMGVNQPSYEASFNLQYNITNGTIPFAQISLVWSDSASGITTYQETYYLLIGANGTATQTYLTGPCHGNVVTISCINFDTGQSIKLSYVINATSHVYAKALLLQPLYTNNIPGFSSPAGFPDAGVLFSAAPTVGFGVTTTRLIAPCNSLIDLCVDNNGQANIVAISLSDPSGSGLLYGTVGTGSMWAQSVANGVRATFPNVALPNGPVLLNIRNTGASGNTATQLTGIINNQSL